MWGRATIDLLTEEGRESIAVPVQSRRRYPFAQASLARIQPYMSATSSIFNVFSG